MRRRELFFEVVWPGDVRRFYDMAAYNLLPVGEIAKTTVKLLVVGPGYCNRQTHEAITADRERFHAMTAPGTVGYIGDEELELRHCVCGSTLSMLVESAQPEQGVA